MQFNIMESTNNKRRKSSSNNNTTTSYNLFLFLAAIRSLTSSSSLNQIKWLNEFSWHVSNENSLTFFELFRLVDHILDFLLRQAPLLIRDRNLALLAS